MFSPPHQNKQPRCSHTPGRTTTKPKPNKPLPMPVPVPVPLPWSLSCGALCLAHLHGAKGAPMVVRDRSKQALPPTALEGCAAALHSCHVTAAHSVATRAVDTWSVRGPQTAGHVSLYVDTDCAQWGKGWEGVSLLEAPGRPPARRRWGGRRGCPCGRSAAARPRSVEAEVRPCHYRCCCRGRRCRGGCDCSRC